MLWMPFATTLGEGWRACPRETLRRSVSTEPRPAGPELAEMRADRIYGLGPLSNEKVPCLVIKKRRLPFHRLHRHEAHRRPHHPARWAFSAFIRSTGSNDHCVTGSKASQIASASAASVFPRFTYGFT